MKAWHFVGKTLRDGRAIPEDGALLKFEDTPVLCEQGLHASLHPFDAMKYAPGDTLCLVESGGVILQGEDKLVCTERTILARMNFTEPLRYFARIRALSVVHLWEPPGVVLDFLMTGDSNLAKAAEAAAEDAAGAAARAAARTSAWAAEAAARASARASAWAADAATWAAEAAAEDAAGAAARAAAGAAARAEAAVAAGAAAVAAAWASAWAAAGAAARAESRSTFEALVHECFEEHLK